MKPSVRSNIVPYSRSYRRAPRFGMGLPPRGKPPRPRVRWWRRLADPQFYLRAVIVVSALLLVAIPMLADGGLMLARPIALGTAQCRVVHVVDGDTADIWCAETGFERARFTGFDAPELFSPQCLTELVAAQKAKWALRAFLARSGDLRMTRGRLDKYDRRLVSLTIAKVPLARRMIQAGYARDYDGGKRRGWCG